MHFKKSTIEKFKFSSQCIFMLSSSLILIYSVQGIFISSNRRRISIIFFFSRFIQELFFYSTFFVHKNVSNGIIIVVNHSNYNTEAVFYSLSEENLYFFFLFAFLNLFFFNLFIYFLWAHVLLIFFQEHQFFFIQQFFNFLPISFIHKSSFSFIVIVLLFFNFCKIIAYFHPLFLPCRFNHISNSPHSLIEKENSLLWVNILSRSSTLTHGKLTQIHENYDAKN